MFSNSKRLFAIAALLLTLPVMAHAQTSRVEGMALNGDYIKDYTAIYGWPSSITNVGNLVYGEFGNSNFPKGSYDRGVGAVLGNLWDGRFGTWGIHMHEITPDLTQGDVNNGVDPNTNTNQSFDLMWGKKLSNMNLGLRLNRSFYKTETTEPGISTTLEGDPTVADQNVGRNIWGFGAGVGFELNPQMNLELSLLYQSRTFLVENNTGTPATSTRTEDDGATAYNIGARMMWQWTSNTVVTPVFRWYDYDLGTKSQNLGVASNSGNSWKGWSLGLAGNWTLGSNDLFVLGATFASNTIEQQYDVLGLTPAGFSPNGKLSESMSPQIFGALETHVNSWLTLRFGANSGAFTHTKYEEKAAGTGAGGALRKQEISSSPFNMELGAGVKVGTLQFDALVAQNFYQNLGWIGSGNPQPGGYFPKVTATYSF